MKFHWTNCCSEEENGDSFKIGSNSGCEPGGLYRSTITISLPPSSQNPLASTSELSTYFVFWGFYLISNKLFSKLSHLWRLLQIIRGGRCGTNWKHFPRCICFLLHRYVCICKDTIFTVQCKYSMCRCGRCGTNWKHFAKMGSGRKLRPGFCPGCYFSFKNIGRPSFVGGKNLVVLRAPLFPFEEKYLINVQIHWQDWLKSFVLTLCSDDFWRTICQTFHFAILANNRLFEV